MTSDRHGDTSRGGTTGRPYKIIGVAALVVALGVIGVWLRAVRGSEDPADNRATFIARRGPLTISVSETGALKAKDPETIRNGVEGRNAITYLIPEGSRVKAGDLLMELDISTLADLKIDQEIVVKDAEALYINAKESLTITTSQAQSDVELATLKLAFAQQDLDKYVKGKYPNDWRAALGKIRLNEEELTRATDTHVWSQRLFDEKYLSLTQLQADQLAKSRAEVNLEVAKNDANLLREYTYKRDIAQYTSDVNQATMALERAQAKARANLAKAKADLEAREQEYGRKIARLDKINEQLKKSKIYAPVDGMVVYATSARGGGFRDDRQPLAEGVTVSERQELFYLPRSTSTVAEVDIPEAHLEKVHAGLPALVTVDALPGKKLVGMVERISPLPDQLRAFVNSDWKVYKTDVALETDDPALRSGMSCQAEIFVEQYADVVYIPLQAVVWVAGKATAYVVAAGGVEEREVETGLDNNSMITIRKGVREGEAVLLAPPVKSTTLESGSKSDANDVTARRINEKLQAANGTGGPAKASGPALPGRGPTPGGTMTEGPAPRGGQGFPSLTPEQTQQMRQKSRGAGGPGGGRRGGPGQGEGQDSGDSPRRGQDRDAGAAPGRENDGNP